MIEEPINNNDENENILRVEHKNEIDNKNNNPSQRNLNPQSQRDINNRQNRQEQVSSSNSKNKLYYYSC